MDATGRLACTDKTLRYELPERVVWTLALDDLGLVGECSTAWGPFADSHFIVFAHKDGTTVSAPFHADGCDIALEALSRFLGAPLRPALGNSTTWSSRVLFPPALVGQPILDLVHVPVAGGLAGLETGLGLGKREAVLAEVARQYLGLDSPERPEES